MKKSLLVVLSAALAGAAVAGPAAKAAKREPVAAGFADWEGVEDRNFVSGRRIAPSDLRQRAVMVIVMDVEKLGEQLRSTCTLASLDGYPGGSADWRNLTFSRSGIIAISLRGKYTPEKFREAMKDRGTDMVATSSTVPWKSSAAAIYRDLKLVGEPEITGTPYAYVLGGTGTDPIWKGEVKPAALPEIKKAMGEARKGLGEWTPLTGVAEPQYYKNVAKAIAAGKPAQASYVTLLAGVKDRDPEKAREAQVMYDALIQYRNDLVFQAKSIFPAYPTVGYVKAQELFQRYPEAKKDLQALEAKMKSNKGVVTLGKIYQKYVEWGAPDFKFKNAGEAKKAALQVGKWKKDVDKLAEDASNITLQNEALILQANLATFADLLATKVP